MIFQFKISLLDIGIPVWRRVQINSNSYFRELHEVIQVSFDWYNSHLHEFSIRKSNGEKIQNIRLEPQNDFQGINSSADWEYFAPFMEVLNESDEILSTWFKKEKDRAVYTYDFGDDWQHDIVLEKIIEPMPDVIYPICQKAKNIAPREDSRGEIIEDYSEIVNPNSKEIAEEINSLLGEYKSHFDIE